MRQITFKILLIEDNPSDARLVSELLSEVTAASFDITWETRLALGHERLKTGAYDLVLLDLELPDSFGLETVIRTLTAFPRIPIVVMSSLKDEELAATAVQRGAQDYLVKGIVEPTILFHSIRYAIERKRTQEAIQESERRFRSLFERSPDGMTIVDVETGSILEFNDVACAQLGYTRDEFAAMHIGDFRTDTPGEPDLILQKILTDGEYTIETRVITKTGEARDFWLSAQVIEISGRKALYSIYRDVTERKQAQTLLAQSEGRLLRAQEMASLGSWELDLADNTLVWSDEVYRIFGVEPQEFDATYETFLDYIHPDDRASVDDAYTGSLRDGRDHYEIEHRVLRKDGAIRYVHEKCEHIRDESGNVVRSIGMVHDITRRKQSEAALSNAVSESRKRWQETEALLAATRSVLDNQDFQDAARPIFDACKNLIGAGGGYVGLLDDDSGENKMLFLDPGDLSFSVDPALPMPVRGLRAIAYRTGKPVFDNDFAASEHARLIPAGHAQLANVLLAPLLSRGNPAGLMSFANKPAGFDGNDVRLATAFAELMSVALANSQARRSLEKSEERFRSITSSASDAIISASNDGGIVTWNKAAEEMFGYSKDEAMGQPISMLMPETYRDRHQEGLDSYLATGEPKVMGRAVELAALKKDGTVFPIELALSSWETTEGTFFGSVIRDDTERRLLFSEIESRQQETEQLALRLTHERNLLQATMENSPQSQLAYLDRDLKFLMVNSAYCDGCGRSKYELIGFNYFDLFPLTGNEAIFRGVIETGEPVEFTEQQFEFPDQPWRGTVHLDWALTPVKGAGGDVQGVVLSLIDVTEKVQSRYLSEALNRISLILNSTLDFDEIMKDVIASAARDLEAESTFLASGREDNYIIRYTQGITDTTPVNEAVTPENAPLADMVLEAGVTMAVADMFGDPRFSDPAKKNGIRSAVAAPLLIRNHIAGVISFRYHSQKREITRAQQDFVEKLSTLISLAIENADLYRSEREVRATVQGYAVQLSLLHEIGMSLNRESDRRKLEQMIVQNAAELTSAGICVMTHADEGKFSLGCTYHAPWYHTQLLSLEEKAPQLHRHLLETITESDQYALRLTRLDGLPWFPEMHMDLRQLLVGILRDTRGRIRGLFILGDRADASSFTKTDEEIVSLLAAQSSVALTSAENFEKEHYVAETLQSCLLPEVPVRDDLDIGLRYLSASELGRIGGDFYDIVELDADKVAIAIGDVCGKGLSAASHTAMVKFMLRAYLEEGRTSGECLSLLNDALCKNLAPDKFITLGLAVLDLGKSAISYSLAGHPLPIICRDNLTLELVVPNTLPLGIIPGYSFPSMDAGFTPSTSMLMYTDGVIEAKSPEAEMFGHQRLMAAFASRSSLPAQQVAQSIVDMVRHFSGERLADDVALLVVRSSRAKTEDIITTEVMALDD